MASHNSPQHPNDDAIGSRATGSQPDFTSWLEKSIQRPVYIDRSDGEKRAEEQLIHEKARTEYWNRWITKVWFAAMVGVPAAVLGFSAGLVTGMAI